MQNKQQLSFKKFLEAKTDKVKSTLKTAETSGSFDRFQLHLLYFFYIYEQDKSAGSFQLFHTAQIHTLAALNSTFLKVCDTKCVRMIPVFAQRFNNIYLF